MTNKDTAHLIEALASNWQAEMRGYHTYQALSEQANGVGCGDSEV
jgi:hypothetical protein